MNAASSGEDGLTIFDAQPSDVVVTELSLPGFDGFELARCIRSRPAGGYPSIVAVTKSAVTLSHQVDARAAGVDFLLDRPSHPWTFAIQVDDLVSESRELRELSRAAQIRGEHLSLRAKAVRARARDVVERSTAAMAFSAVLTLENRILRDLLPSPGIALHVSEAAYQLEADEMMCEVALNELVAFEFLEKDANGRYRRK